MLDEQIALPDYDGPVRQIVVADLGHEAPTLALTHQLRRGAPPWISRYVQRILICNLCSANRPWDFK